MASDQQLPRPADFGVSEDALARMRSTCVDRHRGPLCVGVLAALAVSAVLVLAMTTGSLAAAVYFAPILIIASLILAAPAVIGLLCLARSAERRWRAARDPEFAACSRYLEAVEEAVAGRPLVAAEDRLRWQDAGRGALVAAAAELLGAPAEALDREATGADARLDTGGRLVLLRAEPGERPAAAAAGRELAMACIDLDADEAVLVAPAGAEPALATYLEGRPIRLITAEQLSPGP